MKPSPDQSGDLPAPGTVPCGLAAHAIVRLPMTATQALRRIPFTLLGETIPVSSLKHFDEQTLAVLVALQEAIRVPGLVTDPASHPFRDWGVLAAPQFLGRAMIAPSVVRFQAEGAWGVSPHVVPHRSLHAISGTVSQVLESHGPNFGVGGGSGAESELLLAGLSLLESMRLPGVWLLFSRIHPELDPGDTGRPHPDSFAQAIALALVPPTTPRVSVRLELVVGQVSPQRDPFDFEVLADLLGRMTTRSGVDLSLFPGQCARLSFRHVGGALDWPIPLPAQALATR